MTRITRRSCRQLVGGRQAFEPIMNPNGGRKRVHNADEIMAEIVAKRLVEHLERAGFVVMKKPPRPAPRRWGGALADQRRHNLGRS